MATIEQEIESLDDGADIEPIHIDILRMDYLYSAERTNAETIQTQRFMEDPSICSPDRMDSHPFRVWLHSLPVKYPNGMYGLWDWRATNGET